MAYDAGVRQIWNDNRDRIDLTALGNPGEATQHGIGVEVGIGQYPISVLEHANGVATFAAGGLHADAHFVQEVKKDGKKVYGETLPNPNAGRVINQGAVNDLTYAMSQVAPDLNIDGFQAATKTGTWELGGAGGVDNAHAWNIGFTTKLAAAVWIGSNGDEQPLKVNGQPIYGSTIPRTIWRKFMTAATQAMNLPHDKTQFNEPSHIGRDDPPGSYPSPTPTVIPTTESPTPTEPTPTTPHPTTPPATTPPPTSSGPPGG
jgi:membrane peptidoglycan carboxypeptidase